MKKTIAITAFALSTLIGASAATASSNIYTKGYSDWARTALSGGNS